MKKNKDVNENMDKGSEEPVPLSEVKASNVVPDNVVETPKR